MKSSLNRFQEIYSNKGIRGLTRGVLRWILFRVLSKHQRNMLYTNLRYCTNNLKYEAISDPMKTIWVETDKINYKNSSQEFPGERGLGYIRSGDWDQNKQRISEMDLYKIYRRHFIEEEPWKDTGLLEKVKEEIEKKGHYYHYTSTEEVLEHRCPYIDELHKRIQNEGYKSQKEARTFLDSIKHTDYTPLEILVNFSRDGEILFYTGHNRMMLAKVIGVEEVPVQVMARHEEWQRKRDSVSIGHFDIELECKWKLSEHPDLQDV